MDEYIERLKDGSLKLYALEKELPPEEAVRVRRAFIEGETGTPLPAIGSFTIGIDRVVKRNIENMIGAVQVPVGVAGPLMVHGEYASGPYYIPLATTGIMRDGMTRAPVFATRDIIHAKETADWVETHTAEIREAAESTTKHGEFLKARTYIAGTSVFVRLEFDTKDAMGMNMVTIASQKVGELIERETGARLVSLSGNMCTDKKPAAINLVQGRGKTVVAGVRLSEALIADLLKTDAETLLEVNYRKNLVGSARAASFGFNAQAANVVAGIFIACGQDAAHVVEGSTAITTVDRVEGGVYVSVSIPSLPVGTVGGGTGVETQHECLAMLGVAGGGDPPGANAKAFGEIVAAAVLAGELSLLGALAAQHLARAHQNLGRG